MKTWKKLELVAEQGPGCEAPQSCLSSVLEELFMLTVQCWACTPFLLHAGSEYFP